jgi:hypothetical protein
MRFLILLALLITFNSYAEYWILAGTNKDGSQKMTIDYDSLIIKAYHVKPPLSDQSVVGGKINFKIAMQPDTTFYGYINSDDCSNGSGVMSTILVNGEFETHFWAANNTRMYDFVAIWLCKYYKSKLI